MTFRLHAFSKAVAIIAVASCSANAAESITEHYKYLSDALNRIVYLDSVSTDSVETSKEIADISCETLIKLTADDRLKDVIYVGLGNRNYREDYKKIIGSLSTLTDTIDNEQKALDDIGVGRISSLQALSYALEISKNIDFDKINPDSIMKDIFDLKDRACSLAKSIADDEQRAKKRKALVRGMIGVVLGVADGVVSAYSGGAATPFVSFSAGAGGGMIASAVNDLQQ